jgi:hypothetical protein
LLAIPPAFLLALSLVFYGSPRLRLPVEPILAVLAGGGLVDMWWKAEERRIAFMVVSVAALVGAFTIYMFSAEVKLMSATILRDIGLW